MNPAQPPPESLWPYRLFYFFNFGGLGALFPFLPLLLARRGLDPGEIALVMALIPISGLVVPSLWGALADAIGARVLLLQLAAAGCGLSCLLLLPSMGLWGTIGAMAAFSFFRAPTNALADAAVYSAMQGQAAPYSWVRVWGSAGFLVFVLLLGLLRGSMNPPLLVGSSSLIYLLSAAALLRVPRPPFLRQQGVVREALQVVRQAPIWLFLLGSGLHYVGHSTYDLFYGLHIKTLGLRDAFLGSAWALAVLSEILMMLLMPRILRLVKPKTLLLLAALLAALRWWLTSVAEQGWQLMLIQWLHGATFGVWYVALVHFVQLRCDEKVRATLQSIALSCVGAGMLCGYLLGGWVMKLQGGVMLYQGAALAAMAAALFYWFSGRDSFSNPSR